jgi:cell division protein ZapB
MNDTTDIMNHLEQQVDELLVLCKRLGEENRSQRAQLHHLSSERATLLEQKEQVRAQVDAMITRLRSMENA